MGGTWPRFLLILTALVLVSLITWPIGGVLAAVAVFAAGLLLMAIVHYWHIAALRRWLRDPVPDNLPQGGQDSLRRVMFNDKGTNKTLLQ